MRGSPADEYTDEMIEAILMSRYNQSFSEIQEMPLTKIMFFIRLAEAEDEYEKQELRKQQAKSKRMWYKRK